MSFHLARPSRSTSFNLLAVLVLVLLPLPASAQDEPFDKAEFAARRARVLEKIGDGVAVVPAGEEHIYNVRFRQAPDFYYLTGLEDPGVVLLLNGINKNVVVFAAKGSALREDSTAAARTGLQVLPLENFFFYFSFASGNEAARKLYLQLTPPDDQLHARFEVRMIRGQEADHPLLGREAPLAEAHRRLTRAAPQLAVTDLSPLLDELRWVKTPYEVARLRQAGTIGARAVAEAIRGTRPGMYEYEIAAAAQYMNTRLGARGDAIIAAMKPGVTLKQLKEAAVPVYQKHGWLDAYNKSGRYIGHFVGLSVHDVGGISGSWLDRPLKAGVVFNVEPILEFPDRGIHLRLEDTVLITEAGAENLTASVPAAVEPLLALEKERGINSAPVPK